MTPTANVRIEGLDELRIRMGKSRSVLDAELRPAVRESAVLMRDEAKRRAPGNKLPNTVQLAVLPGGLRAIVGSIAKTALSIHQGRRAGERVNFGLIYGWVRRTGLGSRVSLKTRRAMKPSFKNRGAFNNEFELAWQIVQKIRAQGTKPIPFIIPALTPTTPAVVLLFRDATIRAIRKVAR